jgi:hypothetical protein
MRKSNIELLNVLEFCFCFLSINENQIKIRTDELI